MFAVAGIRLTRPRAGSELVNPMGQLGQLGRLELFHGSLDLCDAHGSILPWSDALATASVIRAARDICLTSWTRMMEAPLAMERATVAAVPSRRSSGGRPPRTL